jgi:hypothetical protein
MKTQVYNAEISIIGETAEVLHFPCGCGEGGYSLKLNTPYFLEGCPCGRKYFVDLRLTPIAFEVSEEVYNDKP